MHILVLTLIEIHETEVKSTNRDKQCAFCSIFLLWVMFSTQRSDPHRNILFPERPLRAVARVLDFSVLLLILPCGDWPSPGRQNVGHVNTSMTCARMQLWVQGGRCGGKNTCSTREAWAAILSLHHLAEQDLQWPQVPRVSELVMTEMPSSSKQPQCDK